MQLRLSATDEILWFVFSNDRHAGPYSSEEFATRANRGEFGEAPYIWTQGMDDWKPLSDFPELETFFLEVKSFAKYRLEEKSDEARLQKLVLSMPDQSFLSNQETQTPSATGFEIAHDVQDAPDDFLTPPLEEAFTPTGAVDPTVVEILRRYRLHLAVLVVILTTGISLGLKMLLDDPRLPARDLAVAEYQELRRTMGESLRYAGPTAAIGLSQTKTETPSFYVASNVDDGTRLELSIEGLPETLLNRFRFSVQTVVTATQHTVKTPALADAHGAPIKAGSYRVRVRKAGEAKVIAQKVYFLGGTQDLEYETKLKAYQESLRSQAALEVLELRQLTETVARQLSDSDLKVTQLFEDLAVTGQARRAKWTTFQTLWNQVDTQLTAIANQWTPESIENEIYYGTLYAKLAQAIRTAQAVHRAQAQLFQPDVKRDDVRAVVARESLAAQNLIQEMRRQVGRLEKLEIKVEGGSGLPPRLE